MKKITKEDLVMQLAERTSSEYTQGTVGVSTRFLPRTTRCVLPWLSTTKSNSEIGCDVSAYLL